MVRAHGTNCCRGRDNARHADLEAIPESYAANIAKAAGRQIEQRP